MKNIKLKHVFIVIAFTIIVVFLFVNLKSVGEVLGTILRVLMPIIYGIIIAYLINWPFKFFHDKCFFKIGTKREKLKGLRKVLSLVCAYILVFGIITVLFVFLIPQLSTSIKSLIDNVPVYAVKIQTWLNDVITFIHDKTGYNLADAATYNKIISMITGSNASNLVTNIVSWAFPFALSTITTVGTGLYNWVLGIVVSIYLISSKDKLLFGCRKMIIAYLPKRAAVKVLKVANFANNKCGRFLIGKIIDSAIIGVICFIFMSIFKFDYALLISVIVGVTNVIPFFGPFIGAIPSAFLLLIVNPVECLWFVIFIIVLQQFDGNILGPKILGESLGLSGFWILFSVLVSGGLFGIPGMLLGVPVFAVIYSLIEDAVNFRIKKRSLEASRAEEQKIASKREEDSSQVDDEDDITNEPEKTEYIDIKSLSEDDVNARVSNEDEKEYLDKIDKEAKIRQSYYNQF